MEFDKQTSSLSTFQASPIRPRLQRTPHLLHLNISPLTIVTPKHYKLKWEVCPHTSISIFLKHISSHNPSNPERCLPNQPSPQPMILPAAKQTLPPSFNPHPLGNSFLAAPESSGPLNSRLSRKPGCVFLPSRLPKLFPPSLCLLLVYLNM